VYQSPNAAPASYTILNFKVDDIDETIDALLARGGVAGMPDAGPARTTADITPTGVNRRVALSPWWDL